MVRLPSSVSIPIYYRLQALAANGARKRFGPLSVAFHFAYPPIRTPVQVADFHATAIPGAVLLRWTLSGEATAELAGIEVEAAAGAAGPYETRTRQPLAPARSMSFADPVGGSSPPTWYRLVLVGRDGSRAFAGPVETIAGDVRGAGARLDPPFESTPGGPVTVRYAISGGTMQVRMSIYDVRGHLVRTLDQGHREPGEHVLDWDRRDGDGVPVARGLYLVRLQADTFEAARRLVLRHRGAGTP